MNDHAYRVSIRIKQPSIDAGRFDRELSLNATHSWSVGQIHPRTGNPHIETYWCYSYDNEESSLVGIDSKLAQICGVIAQNKLLMREISKTGGSCTLRVALFLGGMGGFQLQPHTVWLLAGLHLGLEVEIIPKTKT